MTWWAWCLIGIVVAAFPATTWLKRAGEEEWARYQRRMQREALARVMDGMVARIAELGEAMSQASAQFARFGERLMQQMSEAYGIDWSRGGGKALAVPPQLEGLRITQSWRDEHLRMECGEVLARCTCREAPHAADVEHVCGDDDCDGRWIGRPRTPEFAITAFPSPPYPWMYERHGVTTEAELLEIASREMR